MNCRDSRHASMCAAVRLMYLRDMTHDNSNPIPPRWHWWGDGYVCCSVLQCVAVCCSVLHCRAVSCGVCVWESWYGNGGGGVQIAQTAPKFTQAFLKNYSPPWRRHPPALSLLRWHIYCKLKRRDEISRHIKKRCLLLMCVVVCCSMLQCVAADLCCAGTISIDGIAIAACCSVLQCVAVCCSVLQCGAVCCRANRYSTGDDSYWHTHTHTQASCTLSPTPTPTHTYTHTCIHTHAQIQAHTHTRARIYAHTLSHTHTNTHTNTNTNILSLTHEDTQIAAIRQEMTDSDAWFYGCKHTASVAWPVVLFRPMLYSDIWIMGVSLLIYLKLVGLLVLCIIFFYPCCNMLQHSARHCNTLQGCKCTPFACRVRHVG